MAGKANNHGGKRPGAGRKSKAEEMGLAALLNECFTDDSRRAVINSLIEDASSQVFAERDAARKLLLAYTFGQPSSKTELSTPEPLQQEIVVRFVKSDSHA